MAFENCFHSGKRILMEGALGERLKREYKLDLDECVALAGLVYSTEGRVALKHLWTEYIDIAIRQNMPFIATTPTRRANKERVQKSSFDDNIIMDNVNFLKEIRNDYKESEIYIGGLMGCKGDAYKADDILDRKDAKEFHSWQSDLFKRAGVDFLYAGIMPTLEEALGMADAMADTGLPYIISFMLRENGCLIDGNSLNDAIRLIDKSVNRKPLCYMTNCVHPKVVRQTLCYNFNQTTNVQERFRGIQANTSALSPDELDSSDILMSTQPNELAEEIVKLQELMDITICGGCCGTDARHIEAMAKKLGTVLKTS